MILAALEGFLVDWVVVELTVGLDAFQSIQAGLSEKGEKTGENVGGAIVFEFP